jgi:hypothetical protein
MAANARERQMNDALSRRLGIPSLAVVPVLAIMALTPQLRAADPTIDQDLDALKGVWASPEVTFKRGESTVAVQYTAEFRGKGVGEWTEKQSYSPPFDVGGGILATSSGFGRNFKYAIEEKDGKRHLRLHGSAFERSSDKKGKEHPVVTTYRLKGDELVLDAGEVETWAMATALKPDEVVSIKGAWKRMKDRK